MQRHTGQCYLVQSKYRLGFQKRNVEIAQPWFHFTWWQNYSCTEQFRDSDDVDFRAGLQ